MAVGILLVAAVICLCILAENFGRKGYIDYYGGSEIPES